MKNHLRASRYSIQKSGAMYVVRRVDGSYVGSALTVELARKLRDADKKREAKKPAPAYFICTECKRSTSTESPVEGLCADCYSFVGATDVAAAIRTSLVNRPNFFRDAFAVNAAHVVVDLSDECEDACRPSFTISLANGECFTVNVTRTTKKGARK